MYYVDIIYFPTVPKKTEFLDNSSINIDILTVFFGRREAVTISYVVNTHV